MMTITLNGTRREIPEDLSTVARLLAWLDPGPAPVLIERNGDAVLSREFDEEPVADGDVVEIVRMVAGG